jgi:hypothetical protein
MVAKLIYSMKRGVDEYIATCEELSVRSSGASPADALAGLRRVIEQSQTDWYVLERRRGASPSPVG